MIFGTLIAVGQLILLLMTAAGWGLLVERICRLRLSASKADHLVVMIAGWSAGLLLLQNLVYLDATLNWTSWIGIVAASVGWVQSFETSQRHRWRTRVRSMLVPVILMILVALLQGSALWKHGAMNYYGSAHHDQANYVMLAQFLVDKPFSTTLEQVGLEPWMVKAIDIKDMRLSQSIALGFAGVTSFTDAQVAY